MLQVMSQNTGLENSLVYAISNIKASQNNTKFLEYVDTNSKTNDQASLVGAAQSLASVSLNISSAGMLLYRVSLTEQSPSTHVQTSRASADLDGQSRLVALKRANLDVYRQIQRKTK